MKWAMGLMDYLTRKMVTRMGENIADNAQEALRKKILTLINKHRTKAKPGVTERDLMRYSNKTKTEVKQAIETLQASGEITSIPHGKTSIWCPAIVTRTTTVMLSWKCRRRLRQEKVRILGFLYLYIKKKIKKIYIYNPSERNTLTTLRQYDTCELTAAMQAADWRPRWQRRNRC